jgi:hypothetical protein
MPTSMPLLELLELQNDITEDLITFLGALQE